MKKIIKLACCIILFSTVVSHANAQKGQWKINLNYNYSFPIGDFKNNIISNASPRGASGEFMYDVNKNWSAGLYWGFQDYYQKYPRALYETGDHQVTSAVLSNSVQTLPILLKGRYTFSSGSARVQPYLSAGAGVSFVDFKQYLGEFGGSTSSGNFTAQGGAGVFIPFKKFGVAGLNIGGDYNYISYTKSGYNNLNNLALHAGVYFPMK